MTTTKERNTRKANAEPSGGGGFYSGKLAGRKGAAGWERKMTSHKQKAGLAYGAMNITDEREKGNDVIPYAGGDAYTASGTSIFDPVLCELAYRWFCPVGGVVLDPFAGGSVRGLIASLLSRYYIGVDLSEAQVAANLTQMPLGNADCPPSWYVGDSSTLNSVLEAEGHGGVDVDFVFTCPPYADLEVYSEDPRDISTMPYEQFRGCLGAAIKDACSHLKDDRFACIVIGDARDKNGLLYGIPAHTVQMFEDAGLRLYNDAILETAIASLPVRAKKQFVTSRKLGRCHQFVQVFVKGDPVAATKAVGEVQFGDPVEALQTESDEHGERLTSID